MLRSPRRKDATRWYEDTYAHLLCLSWDTFRPVRRDSAYRIVSGGCARRGGCAEDSSRQRPVELRRRASFPFPFPVLDAVVRIPHRPPVAMSRYPEVCTARCRLQRALTNVRCFACPAVRVSAGRRHPWLAPCRRTSAATARRTSTRSSPSPRRRPRRPAQATTRASRPTTNHPRSPRPPSPVRAQRLGFRRRR